MKGDESRSTVSRWPLGDEKRKGRSRSCCCGVNPAKNGITEEDDTAMPVVLDIAGFVRVMAEVAGLFLLRSPT
jgi:hypothetical protein